MSNEHAIATFENQSIRRFFDEMNENVKRVIFPSRRQ